jgi:hypothetical protein
MAELLAFTALCALLFMFSRPAARGLERFYAHYPVFRLVPAEQLHVNPTYLRVGAVVSALGAWAAHALFVT